MITITHTHQDGTLVTGTDRGDGTAPILKACRFRWFPSIKLWGIPQSRDHLAKRWQIDDAAKQLRAAGHEVTVLIDDTPRDATEVKADRAERLDGRREGLTAAAGRAMTEAERRLAAADAIAERRPSGQPILVGHHSERGARADQKRIENHMDKFSENYGKARHYERAASVVGEADAYREKPPVIIRRIAKTESELRTVPKRWADHVISCTWRKERPDAAYKEQLEARRVFLERQLEADRKALAEHEANGYRCHSRETIHVGDLIANYSGRMRKVVRVNAKTVAVETDYSWSDKLSYERITKVQCPHETAQAAN